MTQIQTEILYRFPKFKIAISLFFVLLLIQSFIVLDNIEWFLYFTIIFPFALLLLGVLLVLWYRIIKIKTHLHKWLGYLFIHFIILFIATLSIILIQQSKTQLKADELIIVSIEKYRNKNGKYPEQLTDLGLGNNIQNTCFGVFRNYEFYYGNSGSTFKLIYSDGILMSVSSHVYDSRFKGWYLD